VTATTPWEIRIPGTIGIRCTDLTVVQGKDLVYSVEWRGQPVPGRGYYLILETAKDAAVRYLQELLELGLDP
jgi:hypothetical protein